MPRKSRQVRGETGAVFEVDAAMVEEPRATDGPFRAPSGPLPASAIKPAAPARSWRGILMAIGVLVALVLGAMASSAATSLPDSTSQSDRLRVRD